MELDAAGSVPGNAVVCPDTQLRDCQQPAAGFDRIGSTTGFTGMPGFGGHQFGTGFERLSSVPYTPGIVDKLAGGDSNQFSRLASLGNFAVAPGNTFARVPSTVNNLPSDAFTRAASSFIPFPNASFERVSSLAGNAAQLQDADAHGHFSSSPPLHLSLSLPLSFLRLCLSRFLPELDLILACVIWACCSMFVFGCSKSSGCSKRWLAA